MISLDDYIIQNSSNSAENKAIFDIILKISDGVIEISKLLYGPDSKDLFGKHGGENIHGEQVEKLDLIATNVFLRNFAQSEYISAVGCEELDDIKQLQNNSSSYIVMMDPLDGSSNVDVSVSIGSIFGIWKNSFDYSDFKSYKGTNQKMAMYAIYGPNTVLVIGYDSKVVSFILDSESKFVLLDQNIKLPKNPQYYSANQSNYHNWSKEVQEYVDNLRSDKSLTQRYVGSLVADFHRNLLKGGIHLNPMKINTRKSKLRLMYEANPLAYINNIAGGESFSDGMNTLELEPEGIHQTVSLIIGNANFTKNVE
tara:strand:+ start:51797 stop:52729 length:933 start_codon:yes stop_codon:yes gene_type:complete